MLLGAQGSRNPLRGRGGNVLTVAGGNSEATTLEWAVSGLGRPLPLLSYTVDGLFVSDSPLPPTHTLLNSNCECFVSSHYLVSGCVLQFLGDVMAIKIYSL